MDSETLARDDYLLDYDESRKYEPRELVSIDEDHRSSFKDEYCLKRTLSSVELSWTDLGALKYLTESMIVETRCF